MSNPKSFDNQFITSIFDKYLTAKLIIEKENFKNINNKNSNDVNDYQITNFQKHIQIVDTVLALMPNSEYKLVAKEFINKNKKWWKTIYQESEYKKLREKAINRFIYLYLI